MKVIRNAMIDNCKVEQYGSTKSPNTLQAPSENILHIGENLQRPSLQDTLEP